MTLEWFWSTLGADDLSVVRSRAVLGEFRQRNTVKVEWGLEWKCGRTRVLNVPILIGPRIRPRNENSDGAW